MEYIHFAVVVFVILAALFYFMLFQEKQDLKPKSNGALYYVILAFAVVFAIKLYLAMAYRGFETDINCFSTWSTRAYQGGLKNFYNNGFCDYPPGYIYVLYGVGYLRELFHSAAKPALDLILLKLPAILCDMGAGVLIYHVARKKFSQISALLLSVLYMMSPAIVVNSSSWGQVDGILAFGIALSIYFATKHQLHWAYIVFVISCLMKLQGIMFTPVLIFATFAEIFLPKFDLKKLAKLAAWFTGSVALFLLLCLPFGVQTIIEQLKNTLSSYPYITVNAFNPYVLFDLNWKHLDQYPTIRTWGTVAIFLLVAFAAWIFYRTDIRKPFGNEKAEKDPSRYYFIGASIIFCMFVLSTKMHERYLFPGLILFLMAYITYPEHKGNYLLYGLLTVAQTYNTAYVLFYYDAKTYFDPKVMERFQTYSKSVATLTLLAFLYFLAVAYRYYINPPLSAIRKRQGTVGKSNPQKSKKKRKNEI